MEEKSTEPLMCQDCPHVFRAHELRNLASAVAHLHRAYSSIKEIHKAYICANADGMGDPVPMARKIRALSDLCHMCATLADNLAFVQAALERGAASQPATCSEPPTVPDADHAMKSP